jgi:hypothetical protein
VKAYQHSDTLSTSVPPLLPVPATHIEQHVESSRDGLANSILHGPELMTAYRKCS